MRITRRRWLWTVVLVLLTLHAAELAATPYCREPDSLFREDPLRFWALNEGREALDSQSGTVMQVNSLGLRGQEPAPPGAGPRLLLLGDSCVYGSGMPDTLTPDRLLESELRARTGVPWQVSNGGIPGYSSFQGLQLLREVGPRLQPEVVVYAYLHADAALEGVSDHERFPEGLSWLRALLWQSRLYRVLRAKLIGTPTSAPTNPNTFWREGNRFRVPPDRQARNMRETAAEVRREGGRALVFLVLPSRTPGRESHPHVQNLQQVGAEEGVVVDLLSRWRSEGLLVPRMFLPDDNLHFSEEGTRRLTADLAEALVRAQVTPVRE